MEENKDAWAAAVYNDLHKHRLETDIGEISAIVDECKYMYKV